MEVEIWYTEIYLNRFYSSAKALIKYRKEDAYGITISCKKNRTKRAD